MINVKNILQLIIEKINYTKIENEMMIKFIKKSKIPDTLHGGY